MKELLSLYEKIIPEAIDLLVLRYNILRLVNTNGPIGRRGLSKALTLSERTVRTEVDFLSDGGIVEVHTTGISLTGEGKEILDSLSDIMKDILKLEDLSEILRDQLGYKKVFISQNSDKDNNYFDDIGKMASEYLLEVVNQNSTIALTGGNTIKNMIEVMHNKKSFPDIMVVPARGGMGRNYAIQSNTLAEKLAIKLGASYRILNVPDNIGDEARRAMLKESEVSETISKIKVSDIVIAGVGRADVMVNRRGLKEEEVKELIKKGAVGEFFGSYFDKDKRIVKQNKAIGMTIKGVKNAKEVLMLAGGVEKAEAIMSIDVSDFNAVLFTDELCARRIIETMNNNDN